MTRTSQDMGPFQDFVSAFIFQSSQRLMLDTSATTRRTVPYSGKKRPLAVAEVPFEPVLGLGAAWAGWEAGWEARERKRRKNMNINTNMEHRRHLLRIRRHPHRHLPRRLLPSHPRRLLPPSQHPRLEKGKGLGAKARVRAREAT